MPRIVFVTPMHFGAGAYLGGGERYPMNIANGVVAASTDVHLDLIGSGEPARVTTLQPRFDVHVLPVTWPGHSPLDHVSSSIVDVLEDADLVHIHQIYTRSSQVALLAAKTLNIPVVVTDHGGRTTTNDRPTRYPDLADMLIAYSDFGAGLVPTQLPTRVIKGGVDHRFFHPAEAPQPREHVLYVGRLLRHKGIDRLLAALPPDLPLLVVGRPYDPQYTAYVQALAGTREVRFVHGADDSEIRELYRKAYATVLPSVHRDAWGGTYEKPELMGLTALESMACGTPAIVSTAGALPEFVRHGETGFVYEDLQALREILTAFLDGTRDADALGRQAREVVEREYALDVVGRRFLAAYEEVWAGCAS